MRYRYARCSSGTLVDVLALDPTRRVELGPFSCIGCGRRMLAALGQVNVHHFRHDGAQDCNGETYLHAAAKAMVAHGFTRAVAEGRPYPITLRQPVTCRKHEASLGRVCTTQSTKKRLDLTRWLRTATTEAQVENFVADVLLEGGAADGRPPDRLLIEIAVTHPCTPEKSMSGLRIVEIAIREETEIAALAQGIDTNDERVSTWGFKPLASVERQCRGGCTQSGRAFLVYRSGKSALVWGGLDDIAVRARGNGVVHVEMLPGPDDTEDSTEDSREPASYERLVEEAHFERGLRLRACLLCRHQAPAWSPFAVTPLFCLARRMGVHSNDAADCAFYTPLPSREALIGLRRPRAARTVTRGGAA